MKPIAARVTAERAPIMAPPPPGVSVESAEGDGVCSGGDGGGGATTRGTATPVVTVTGAVAWTVTPNVEDRDDGDCATSWVA